VGARFLEFDDAPTDVHTPPMFAAAKFALQELLEGAAETSGETVRLT
jgi:hypothetical protein